MNTRCLRLPKAVLGLVFAGTAPASAQTTPVAMSAPWAQAMCNAWNADAGLTEKLVESRRMKNDAGRGFKTMRIYRADCPKSARIESQIALKDNNAKCVYGGAWSTSSTIGSMAMDRTS